MNEDLKDAADQVALRLAFLRFARDYVDELRVVLVMYQPVSPDAAESRALAGKALSFMGPVEHRRMEISAASAHLLRGETDPAGWFHETALTLIRLGEVLDPRRPIQAADMEETGLAWNRLLQIRDALSAV